MINEQEFERLLAEERKKFGIDKDAEFETVQAKADFEFLEGLIRIYGTNDWEPNTDPETEKLFCLQGMTVMCGQYLDAVRNQPKVYAPRVLAVIAMNKEAAQEVRRLKPQGRALARANFQKGIAKISAQRAQEKAFWGQVVQNASKISPKDAPGGGKKINEEFWREIFDPRHRPHTPDDVFRRWKELTTTTLPNGTPNPQYDESVSRSFYAYLDTTGGIPNGHYYKYVQDEIERQGFRVVVEGGVLWRRGRRFETRGWELNNGNRVDWDAHNRAYPKSYPGSNQSMIRDHGIWVMSTSGEIYSGPQRTNTYDMHHSGFLAGAPVRAGGEWLVIDGRLKLITGSSGHYTPNFTQYQNGLRTLLEAGVDLKAVAAEWPYAGQDDLRWFNAAQLVQPGVKASWPAAGHVAEAWPKFVGRPLREVNPMQPTVCLAWPPTDLQGHPVQPPVTGPVFDAPAGGPAAAAQRGPGKLAAGKFAAFNKPT